MYRFKKWKKGILISLMTKTANRTKKRLKQYNAEFMKDEISQEQLEALYNSYYNHMDALIKEHKNMFDLSKATGDKYRAQILIGMMVWNGTIT